MRMLLRPGHCQICSKASKPATGPASLSRCCLPLRSRVVGRRRRTLRRNCSDGGRFSLSEQYADNVVVVNFWYPSCPPCREEMPEFQRAWEELEGEPVRFLGLFVPRGFDTENTAREFVAELGLTFDFATDHRETIATAYGIEFYPTTWFIDRGGKVAATFVSALDAERITSIVGELVGD